MTTRNLASERVRLGYSQEQLASILGVTKKTIGQYENGKSTPTAEFIDAAASLFKCSSDYLLGRTDERLPHAPTSAVCQ